MVQRPIVVREFPACKRQNAQTARRHGVYLAVDRIGIQRHPSPLGIEGIDAARQDAFDRALQIDMVRIFGPIVVQRGHELVLGFERNDI